MTTLTPHESLGLPEPSEGDGKLTVKRSEGALHELIKTRLMEDLVRQGFLYLRPPSSWQREPLEAYDEAVSKPVPVTISTEVRSVMQTK